MCLFIETIRIEKGRIANAPYHNERMNKTRRDRWGDVPALRVEDYIDPSRYMERTRCRLTYGREVESVVFFPYSIRPVRSLRLVVCDEAEYRYKRADRSLLDKLYERRGTADDVLIVRKGLLTDTSIANIALWDGERWYTPEHPLLPGTQRRRLIDEGVIHEREIRAADLTLYRKARLFNAMIDFGEVEIDTGRIEAGNG